MKKSKKDEYMRAVNTSFFEFDSLPNPQLFLIKPTKEQEMADEIKRLRDQCERVRKGQYAKIGDLKKVIEDVSVRLNNLEVAICRGRVLAEKKEE